MSEVSIRELRNYGGDVVDRAARAQRLTITRSGSRSLNCDHSVENRVVDPL
ncbi:MAG TPA: type II toxin-antitoxin system prevent-host-death family antitoxin [Acidimicrobiia bacterium]|nr:type II toxin-antitoxin system prevent-host-death family antitoxin [Acidimicrobiia bacterium]